MSKSADIQKRVLICESPLDLSFYNSYNNLRSSAPDVLPFKFFRQRRFIKISNKSIDQLKKRIDKSSEQIERAKEKLLQFNDPNQIHIPFFMKIKKRKSHFIIPKNLSPMPSRSPSPLIRSPIDKNSPFNDKNPANTVSIFKKNKLLKKKNAFEIKKLKRMGFLKKEIKKREDSLDENPFHALMWRNIKKVRKKQEVYQEKFEDVLLRIALDRKEKFYDLNKALPFEKISNSPKINKKMAQLYREKIQNNNEIHESYSNFLLELYEKNEFLSKLQISFLELLKKTVEAGMDSSFYQRDFLGLLNEKFTEEQQTKSEFKCLFDQWQNKINSLHDFNSKLSTKKPQN